jgi:hypothetical protein
MLNREYHKRARQQGETAIRRQSSALSLPWAGIFEPWRPLVLMAELAEQTEQAKRLIRGKNAAKGCKNRSQLLLFDGKLRGVQLALFPENDVQKPRETSADSTFPPLAGMIDPMGAEEILTEDELAAEFEKLKSF